MLDAVEMGQQILMAKRYRHAWGVGRHLLGSQILPLLARSRARSTSTMRNRDPVPAQPPGISSWDRAGLYQWGPDLPTTSSTQGSRPAGSSTCSSSRSATGRGSRRWLRLKSSVAKPARPWR